MSLLRDAFGIKAAADGILSDLQNPALWLTDFFSGSRTTSGEDVGPETALTLPAYYAAIRNISEDVAKLPFNVFKRVQPRGKEKQDQHAVNKILDQEANPEMSAMAFREVMTSYALGWGNGIAEIVTDGSGTPVALFPIHPSRVSIRRDEKDEIVYDIRSDETINRTNKSNDDRIVRLSQDEVFHLHGLGSNGIFGYSVAQLMSESIGLSVAAQKFGAAFFGNGTTVAGVLEHPSALDEEARNNLRNSWNIMHQSAGHSFKPAVLEEGMTWKPIAIPPEEAQFLETRAWQVEDLARAFRIPPHKIGHLERSTFSNIEEQNTEYVTDTLMPHLIRWEKEVQRKLFKETEKRRLFAQHNVNGLLRGDIKTRSEFYRSQLNIGALSPNDIRELENLNPIGPEGDEYFMQLNMATLKRIVTPPEEEEKEEPVEPEEEENQEDSDENEENEEESGNNRENSDENDENEPKNGEKDAFFTDILALKPVLLDASQRVIRKEIKAISRAMKKYAGNPEDFEKYLDKFYSEQKQFILTSFQPAMQVVLDDSEKIGCLGPVVEQHLGLMRSRVVDTYRLCGSLPEQESDFKQALLSMIEIFIMDKKGENDGERSGELVPAETI